MMPRLLSLFLTLALLGLTACDVSPDAEAPSDAIDGAAAHWIDRTHLLWVDAPDVDSYELRYSLDADVAVDNGTVSGGESLALTAGIDLEIDAPYRHIADAPAFELDADRATATEALRGQLVALAYNENDEVIDATLVQRHGAIDYYFAYDEALYDDGPQGPLGPQYGGFNDSISVYLWAPTAQSVKLELFDADKNSLDLLEPSKEPPSDGVWRFDGDADWDRTFYRFHVEVYHPTTNQMHTFEVTDPYSLSLSTDSEYSQFVDLENDESLKPDGWDAIQKEQPRPTDITAYEGHMRDFSVHDATVPEEHRGTYRAFTHADSDGMQHLQRLSEAGLTHFHLLPFNDIATVNEDLDDRVDITDPYERICELVDYDGLDAACEEHGDRIIQDVFAELADEDPATEAIQAPYGDPGRMDGMAIYDGFNWGYDPFHFNAPQGSYSTDPDGAQRVLELREMVSALNDIGLHVVQDVVYNHTFASADNPESVLDKVVPGYYHRYDPVTGDIETSTCCDNTAAEFKMVERLIIDSVVLWAKHYKIDSFRFDLMGHHPRSTMENVSDALAELTLDEHGVDGENIYIYGEGWNFGEVADDRIFDQATQFNMGSTGIGNFNDRMRDAIRGGNFTDTGRQQGFANGLHLFPNEDADEESLNALLDAGDRIRVGMTGNLASYTYENREGQTVEGSHEMIGYADEPQESVNYIDKHDNETLWDNTQVKLPRDLSMDDRVRVHMLSNAFINYGQGVPFYQMGSDILRSKSLDRNSFDSGDWFNLVDFSLSEHGWARGLPPAWDNEDRWDDMRDFLRDDRFAVQTDHMETAHELFLEQLQMRYSSPLFRLASAAEIKERVAFHNTGPDQTPGIIAMTISDGACAGPALDDDWDGLVVVFNADDDTQSITLDGLSALELHPMHANSTDTQLRDATAEADGTISVPALSAAVFGAPATSDRDGIPCN